MKSRLLTGMFGGLVCMFLLAGAALAQGGELVAAEYGAGGRRVDVTPQVRSFMHDGVLRFDVTDQTFGTDPARGHVKDLAAARRNLTEQPQIFFLRAHFPGIASLKILRPLNSTIDSHLR